MFAAVRGAANTVIATGFASDKAAEPPVLVAAAAQAGVEAVGSGTVEAALSAALAAPGAPPHVIIAGSLYMAGEGAGAQPRDLADLSACVSPSTAFGGPPPP